MSLQRALLACGPLAALAYVAGDIAGACTWPAYRWSAQTVAVLVASDAPTRPTVVRYYIVYEVLLLLFAVGVWRTRVARKRLHAVAALMIAIVILGALSYVVFPGQVPRVGTMPLTGTANVLEAAIGITIMFAFVRSADALTKVFAYFAITCAVVFIACGAAAGIEARVLADASTTPGLGLMQRICILTFLVWVTALSVGLQRVRIKISADSAQKQRL